LIGFGEKIEQVELNAVMLKNQLQDLKLHI